MRQAEEAGAAGNWAAGRKRHGEADEQQRNLKRVMEEPGG